MQTTTNVLLAGDALAAARAVRTLSVASASHQVLPERGVRPLALQGHNVILLGSPNYSPYAARILERMPFSVYYDPATREEVIADGIPGAGAKRVFLPKRDAFSRLKQVYGLLTVLPSHRSAEGEEQTVVFSGVTSAGPQAGMEFFTSPANLHDLQSRLTHEGHSILPRWYQVVVRCGIEGGLALTWGYAAHRRPPSHP